MLLARLIVHCTHILKDLSVKDVMDEYYLKDGIKNVIPTQS